MSRAGRRSAFVAASLAALGGCLSFDSLTGDDSPGADASIDAATDAPQSSDAPIVDAATDDAFDSGSTFDCSQIDAALCDDFNRDAAIPFSDLRWAETDCLAGDALSVNGELNTSVPSTSNSHCELVSKPLPNTDHFTLDFDMTFETTDAAAPAAVVAAQVNFTLAGVNDAGIHSITFQFLVTGVGNASWQLLNYYPDAAVSPSKGEQYISYTLATANPFIDGARHCHISLVGSDMTTNPTGTGTSTCDGAHPIAMNALSHPGGYGLSANGQLVLGYSDNGSSEPSWTVHYDNVVYAAQ